jgi:hypothetical protein
MILSDRSVESIYATASVRSRHRHQDKPAHDASDDGETRRASGCTGKRIKCFANRSSCSSSSSSIIRGHRGPEQYECDACNYQASQVRYNNANVLPAGGTRRANLWRRRHRRTYGHVRSRARTDCRLVIDVVAQVYYPRGQPPPASHFDSDKRFAEGLARALGHRCRRRQVKQD